MFGIYRFISLLDYCIEIILRRNTILGDRLKICFILGKITYKVIYQHIDNSGGLSEDLHG